MIAYGLTNGIQCDGKKDGILYSAYFGIWQDTAKMSIITSDYEVINNEGDNSEVYNYFKQVETTIYNQYKNQYCKLHSRMLVDGKCDICK